jgi:hypothetical protein
MSVGFLDQGKNLFYIDAKIRHFGTLLANLVPRVFLVMACELDSGDKVDFLPASC